MCYCLCAPQPPEGAGDYITAISVRDPRSTSRGRPPTPPPDEYYPIADDYTFNTVRAQEFGGVIVGEVRESK